MRRRTTVTVMMLGLFSLLVSSPAVHAADQALSSPHPRCDRARLIWSEPLNVPFVLARRYLDLTAGKAGIRPHQLYGSVVHVQRGHRGPC